MVNAVLVVAQVVGGVVAHSSGLLADAGHNLTDVAAVVLSLLAVRWAMRPRSEARSFGNHRGTILAALVNAAVLAVVTVAIVAEGVTRLVHPPGRGGVVVVLVAVAAMVVNVVAALVAARRRAGPQHARRLRPHGGRRRRLGLRGGGRAGHRGHRRSWERLDPVASLVVAALIIREALRLVRASADVLLESTPADVDLAELRAGIAPCPGWPRSTTSTSGASRARSGPLSAHLVLPGHPSLEEAQEVAGRVRTAVAGPFDLGHTTFELECERCVDEDGGDPCGMDEVQATLQATGGSAAHPPHG